MSADDETIPDCQALQTKHFFSTVLDDRPFYELEVDEIDAAIWRVCVSEVEHAITRILTEGDLSSTMVRDTVRLIVQALRRLSVDIVKCQQVMEEVLPSGFWYRLLKALALPPGRRLAEREAKKSRAQAEYHELNCFRDSLTTFRLRLAREIDKLIVPLLLAESAEYRALSAEIEGMTGQITQMNRVLDYFKDLMDALHKLRGGGVSFHSNDLAAMQLRKIELRKALPAMLKMASVLTSKQLDNRYAALLTLESAIATVHREIEPKRHILQMMCEKRKQQIYGYLAPDVVAPKEPTVFITP